MDFGDCKDVCEKAIRKEKAWLFGEKIAPSGGEPPPRRRFPGVAWAVGKSPGGGAKAGAKGTNAARPSAYKVDAPWSATCVAGPFGGDEGNASACGLGGACRVYRCPSLS